MKELKLNQNNLHQLQREVDKPEYLRQEIKTGIVHIGVGAFHRAHQACYTDQILTHNGSKDWGICGIGLLDKDRQIINSLLNQDGLYTLMTINPDGTINARIISSITEFIFAPPDPLAAIEKMAHPDIKIITLTITEGGYNFDSSTGDFLIDNPLIQWDLNHPERPKTVYGYLLQSLKLREKRGLDGLTLLSCDNIQKNGDLLKKMLLSFTRVAEPSLLTWIEEKVSFPNSMVDRITPAPTEATRRTLREKFGIDDYCAVLSESFCQWVIEDSFSNGRPAWEKAGARFVPEVSPYEKMKIRLLNAGHSLLGFCGALYGYKFIHEAAHDKLFSEFLRSFMDNEVTPVLDEVPGIDLNKYKDSLIERFRNTFIRDQLSRICMQSSAKIPKFLLPTIYEQLRAEGSVERSALIVAAWCRYCEGADESGNTYTLEDDMKVILQEKAFLSRQDKLSFLRIKSVFGDLADSKRFTETYSEKLDCIYQKGIIESVKKVITN